jgi:hypothetical protein
MRHLNDPPPLFAGSAALLICLNTFADFAAKWGKKKTFETYAIRFERVVAGKCAPKNKVFFGLQQ